MEVCDCAKLKNDEHRESPLLALPFIRIETQFTLVSLWGVHIGIAVIITTPIVGSLPLLQVERWVIIFLSGVWATVPDWWWFFTDRFVAGFEISWYAQTYKAMFHDSLVANVFWFHGVIDTIGTDNALLSLFVAASSVAIFVAMEYYVMSDQTSTNDATG